ncbi:MAG: glycoside hydrolase family 15 protein [Ktedonobacteraceae bacterium]
MKQLTESEAGAGQRASLGRFLRWRRAGRAWRTGDRTPANKEGFGTAQGAASKVWYTLQDGRLTEVYYPDLGTPSVRDLEFIVSDGHSFAERAFESSTHVIQLVDLNSLTYQQVDTEQSGRWRLTMTYVTDPSRSSLLLAVRFESLTHSPYLLYVYYDPSLTNNGMDDSGSTQGSALVAADGHTASALVTAPGLIETSNGYLGTSDGWTDISEHYQMEWHYQSAPNGNVVQTGRTTLNGVGRQNLTLALGFGSTASEALPTAQQSLGTGFGAVAQAYANGWHTYLASLQGPPASLTTSLERETYQVSEMVLAASEDKTYRGAYIASPTMPWAWGTGLENPSGAYHLVWARDLYEIATALIAEGDRGGAGRALDYLFNRQQKPDGSFPQNSLVDGTPHWSNLQLDEVADPIILAYQLGRTDPITWSHVKRAADFIVGFQQGGFAAPWTPEERWENQSGYSPATIASEIAGLVCAAQIAQANGDATSTQRYLATADSWQAKVENWTVTNNGPYSPKPYFLRLTKDGKPNVGTTYSIGDGGPGAIDQRRVVDPSFLEVVRLGIKSPKDAAVLNTLQVVDNQLGVVTSNGEFWHRYNFDGYGETRTGGPWTVTQPDTFQTLGRIWPVLAGERGEYELAAGDASGANAALLAMALAGNDGYLVPEQVWDNQPPAGEPGFPPGEGTFSATPLGWSHAQFIRLAWDIEEGRLAEQPSVVACRYVGCS